MLLLKTAMFIKQQNRNSGGQHYTTQFLKQINTQYILNNTDNNVAEILFCNF